MIHFTFVVIQFYFPFQCSNTSSGAEPCEGSRSCHCPVLRPGPALGCNFCWNTIDTHGRILRRKTKYHCPECQTNLCIVPCFQVCTIYFWNEMILQFDITNYKRILCR